MSESFSDLQARRAALSTGAPKGFAQQTEGRPSSGLQELSQQWQNKYGEPSWVTGGQRDSQESGWNTPFYEEMRKQYNEVRDSSPRDYYRWSERPDFTGYVTNDSSKDASGRQASFGDMYEKGVFKGNILDPNSGFEKNEALNILAAVTLDPATQRKAYNATRDNPEALDQAIQSWRKEENKVRDAFLTQDNYEQEVSAQEGEWSEGQKKAGSFWAGFAGGAGVGATGFLGGPVLGAITTLAGGFAGGFAAQANRDSLVDQAARAAIQTEKAKEQYGGAAALATGLNVWSGTAMSAMSPLTNTLHGITDNNEGTIGDGEVEWYEKQRGLGGGILGFTATLGDSVLQFANAPARIAYLATMGGSVAGQVGQITLQDGATWDDRRGAFHEPENAGQWLATLGAVGIDAIQMGGAGAIGKVFSKSKAGLTGLSDDVTKFSEAGRVFTRSADGELKSRLSITLLAPSEAVQFASVRAQALRMAAKRDIPGAITADDLYQAATQLGSNRNWWRASLVNGFGEGLEEGSQATLEALSHGWTPQFDDIFRAYAQGMASGVGMSLGSRIASRSSGDSRELTAINFRRAQDPARALQPLTQAEYDRMSPQEKALQGLLTDVDTDLLKNSAARAEQQFRKELVQSVVSVEAVNDAIREQAQTELNSIEPALEGTFSIVGVSNPDFAYYGGRMSARVFKEMLTARGLGLQEQVDADPQGAAAFTLAALNSLNGRILPLLDQVEAVAGNNELGIEGDLAQVRQLTTQINQILSEAWHSEPDPAVDGDAKISWLSKAATFLISRSPNNNPGSFMAIMPVISENETMGWNLGSIGVNEYTLAGTGGDFDGDAMQQRVRIMFEGDDDVFYRIRTGLNRKSTVSGAPNINVRKFESDIINEIGISFSDSNLTAALRGTAEVALTAMRGKLRLALGRVPGAEAAVDTLIENIKAGKGDAKVTFLLDVSTNPENQITLEELRQRGSDSPGMGRGAGDVDAYLDWIIQRELNNFQKERAARFEDTLTIPTGISPIPKNSTVWEVVARAAATAGATLSHIVSGSDPFRAFGKLKHGAFRSATVGAKETIDQLPADVRQMVEMYNSLSSGLEESKADAIYSQDTVETKALSVLKSFARTMVPGVPEMEAVMLISGLEVPSHTMQSNPDGSTTYSYTSNTTLAQEALRVAAQEQLAKNPELMQQKPELAKKYTSYLNLSPANATMTLLDGVQAISILGSAAHNFGADMTVGQIVKLYINQSPGARKQFVLKAKQDPRYIRKSRTDLPLKTDEFLKNDIHAYQMFVDTIVEAGNKTISVDRKTGKLAEGTSAAASQARTNTELSAGLHSARAAIIGWAELYGLPLDLGKTNNEISESAIAQVLELLDQRKELGRKLFEMIPSSLMTVVVDVQSSRDVAIEPWVVRSILESDPSVGAMTYFRGLFVADLNRRQASTEPRPSTDRLITLYERLHREAPVRALEFEKNLLEMDSVEEFMAYVNRELVQNEAPHMAWRRDAAEFDAMFTNGGWSLQLESTARREAITKFRNTADAELATMESERAQRAYEGAYILDLQQERDKQAKGERGASVSRWNAFQTSVSLALQFRAGLGPSALMNTLNNIAVGIFQSAEDKGESSPAFSPLGDHVAADALSWATGQEHILDQLTAQDPTEAANNPQRINRGGARFVDAFGRPFTWESLTASQILDMWTYGTLEVTPTSLENSSMRPMLRAMLFPAVNELTETGKTSAQFLGGTSLQDFGDGTMYSKALGGKSYESKQWYVSFFDSMAQADGHSLLLSRKIADLVVARTQAARRSLTAGEIRRISEQALEDVVDLVRGVGAYGDTAEIARIAKAHRKSITNARRTEILGSEGPLQDQLANLMDAALQILPSDGFSRSDEDIATSQYRSEKLKEFLGDVESVEQVVSIFHISEAEWTNDIPTTQKKKEFLYSYILNQTGARGEFSSKLRSLSEMEPTGKYPIAANNEAADQKFWAGVSREAMVHYITDKASVVALGISPIMHLEQDYQLQYLDRTFLYLTDDILDSGCEIFKTARAFQSRIKAADLPVYALADTDLIQALERVGDRSKLKQWTPEIPRLSVQGQSRMTTAGAAQQVKRAGMSAERQNPINQGTLRTSKDPLASGVKARELVLSEDNFRRWYEGEDVNGKAADIFDQDLGFTDVTGQRNMALMEITGSFLEQMTLVYTDVQGNTIPVDLMAQRRTPGKKFLASDALKRSALVYTSLDEIRAAITDALPSDYVSASLQGAFFSNQDKPATADFARDVLFDGGLFTADGIDQFNSLNAGLYFSPEGLNVVLEVAALKSGKTGKEALRLADDVPITTVQELEQVYGVGDMHGLITAKTLLAMDTDGGYGKLDPTFYPAVRQQLRMRHAVRGFIEREDGVKEAVYLSADEVIAHQAQQDGLPLYKGLPVQGAELYFISTKQFRSLLGDEGVHSANFVITRTPELDDASIIPWDGEIQSRMEKYFPEAMIVSQETGQFTAGDIRHEAIANRGSQRRLNIAARVKEENINPWAGRFVGWQVNRAAAERSRAADPTRYLTPREGVLSRIRNGLKIREAIPDMAGHALGFASGSSNYKDSDSIGSIKALAEQYLMQELELHDKAGAWLLNLNPTVQAGSKSQGYINGISLLDSGSKEALGEGVVWGDFVGVMLETAGHLNQEPAQQLRVVTEALHNLAGRGATIYLTHAEGNRELMTPAKEVLEQLGYEQLPGADVFKPIVFSNNQATIDARYDRLSDTRAVHSGQLEVTFLGDNIPVMENTIIKVDARKAFGRYIVKHTAPSPSTSWGEFAPAGTFATRQAVGEILAQLADPTSDMFAAAVKQGQTTAEEFLPFAEHALQSYDVNTGLPARGSRFQQGDIRVLLHPRTDNAIIVREGYQPFEDLGEALAQEFEGLEGGLAVYSAKPEANATIRTGIIESWDTRSGYGLGHTVRIPVGATGTKMEYELRGMKGLVAMAEDVGIEIPETPLIPGFTLENFMSLDDWKSKDAIDANMGTIDSFQKAFGYLGGDFTPELAQFFGIIPDATQWDSIADVLNGPADPKDDAGERLSEAQEAIRQQVKNYLLAIRRDMPVQSNDAIVSLQDELLVTRGSNMEVLTSMMTAAGVADTGALARVEKERDAITLIGIAAITTMMSAKNIPDHVISYSGVKPNSITNVPDTMVGPELFFRIMDARNPRDSQLREYLLKKLNNRLNLSQIGVTQSGRTTGYKFLPDFRLMVVNEDPRKNMTGFLDFSNVTTPGDTAEARQDSRDRQTSAKRSGQNIRIAASALSARVFQGKDLKETERQLNRTGYIDYTDRNDFYRLFKPSQHVATRPVIGRALNVAEEGYIETGEIIETAFRQTIDLTELEPEQVAWVETQSLKVTSMLGLPDTATDIVQIWVRELAGAPRDANPTTEGGKGLLGFPEIEQAIYQMQKNIEKGLYPTAGSVLSIPHANDVEMIYNAQQSAGAAAPFKLRLSGRAGDYATKWMDYVNVALGSVNTRYNGMWLHGTDSYLNSYRRLGGILGGLPISMSDLKNQELLDPETSAMVLSFDSEVREQLRNVPAGDPGDLSFEQVMGGSYIGGKFYGNYPKGSPLYKRLKYAEGRWADESGAGRSNRRTLADAAKGQRFIEEATFGTSMNRTLMHTRAALGMLNPFAHFSSVGEVGVNYLLEDSINFLTGDGLGKIAQATNTVTGGQSSSYDHETFQAAQATINSLSRNKEWLGSMYRTIFDLDGVRGTNPVERFFEKAAKMGGKFMDPTYGSRGKPVARHYLDNVMRSMVDTGLIDTMSLKSVIKKLGTDPNWVAKNLPDIHNMASRKIAELRTVQPTTLSLAADGIMNPLLRNSNWGISTGTTIMLKIPYMFFGFQTIVANRMLGTQFLNQIAALAIQGNRPGKKFSRMQAFLEGTPVDEVNTDQYGIDFASEVMTTVDMSRVAIQSGLTHTMTMGAAMLFGELGLGGEDEEDKRRRRAEQLGAGQVLYDPRDIKNDFRNGDVLFLENLPDWIPHIDKLKGIFRVADSESPGRQRSMAQMHWTLKQFISPLMGINRFAQTGNLMHVVQGFEDAIGALPILNVDSWDESSRIARELARAAEGEAQLGTPENMANAFGYLLKVVMKYEGMLMESSFINNLYVTMDKYDRAPWTLAATMEDGSGKIRRDELGLPMQTDVLNQYLDENGELAEGFAKPTWGEQQMKQYGERKAVLGFMGSFFSGRLGTPDSWNRYDQVVKTVKIDKTALSDEDAQTLIMVQWDPYNKREMLTDAGVEALMRGIRAKSVKPGDASLENVFVSYEQRQAALETLSAQILQEAYDYGLDTKKAEKHLKETLYGSSTNPYTTPLIDVIFSQGDFDGAISYSPKQVYRQLNTTYVMGPDGKPYATGVSLRSVGNFFGINPLIKFNAGELSNTMGVDDRLNSTDAAANLNTGYRSLDKVHSSEKPMSREDILKDVEKMFNKVTEAIKDAQWAEQQGRYGDNYGRGYSRFASRRPYSRGGYGSSGYKNYGGSGFVLRRNSPVRNDSTYGRNVPFTNTDNVSIRRATIRRERYSSTRGRLNEWQ